jgi:hypothetical protein
MIPAGAKRFSVESRVTRLGYLYWTQSHTLRLSRVCHVLLRQIKSSPANIAGRCHLAWLPFTPVMPARDGNQMGGGCHRRRECAGFDHSGDLLGRKRHCPTMSLAHDKDVIMHESPRVGGRTA